MYSFLNFWQSYMAESRNIESQKTAYVYSVITQLHKYLQ